RRRWPRAPRAVCRVSALPAVGTLPPGPLPGGGRGRASRTARASRAGRPEVGRSRRARLHHARVSGGPRKRWKDLVWTTTAYFGEGLPYSFLHQLVTEYLTGTGASRAVIGYTSWFHLPVALKPLWAPWIDVGGARRGVTIGSQVALGMGMMGTAALVDDAGGAARTFVFWAALSVLSIVHAIHDIACDGFYIVALDERGRALYSGTRIAAFRAAMYVGSGALVIVAGVLESWTLSFAL